MLTVSPWQALGALTDNLSILKRRRQTTVSIDLGGRGQQSGVNSGDLNTFGMDFDVDTINVVGAQGNPARGSL